MSEEVSDERWEEILRQVRANRQPDPPPRPAPRRPVWRRLLGRLRRR